MPQQLNRSASKRRLPAFDSLEPRCLLTVVGPPTPHAINTAPALAATLPYGASDFVENAAGTTVYATVPSLHEVVFINESTLASRRP